MVDVDTQSQVRRCGSSVAAAPAPLLAQPGQPAVSLGGSGLQPGGAPPLLDGAGEFGQLFLVDAARAKPQALLLAQQA